MRRPSCEAFCSPSYNFVRSASRAAFKMAWVSEPFRRLDVNQSLLLDPRPKTSVRLIETLTKSSCPSTTTSTVTEWTFG